VKRLLFYFLFCGIFFPLSTSAQSSIYQDAKELAVLFKETPAPILDFKGLRSGTDSAIQGQYAYHLKKDGGTINSFKNTFNKPPRYPLESFGRYELKMNAYFGNIADQKAMLDFEWDALSISFQDSTFVIKDSLLAGVEIVFSPDTLMIFSIYVMEEENLDGSAFDSPIPPYQLKQVLSFTAPMHYKKMTNILRAHADFRDIEDNNEGNIYTNIKQKYRTNPFFNDLIRRKDIAFPNTPKFVSSLGKSTDYFPDFFRKNYEWHELLYGDSILQLQKQVSYQDVVSNYRTPIVTSQNELIDANNRINNKNKNRNVLDAKTVAVGLSDFIAERAQEELNLTFFNRFRKNLEQDSELTVLFPNTKKLLYQFEISNYKTLLSNARESFTIDLDNLGLNFPAVLELDKYKKLYNSPEVYNLALIYSIANLAYREVPVETILISTFQKLQDRQRQLDKSINLTLAEAILNPLPPSEKASKKKESFTPSISRGSELSLLENYIKEYLWEVGKSKNSILESTQMLGLELENERYEFMFSVDAKQLSDTKDRYGAQLKNIWNTNRNNLQQGGLPKYFNNRSIIYNNQSHPEAQYLDFYRKTVFANLKGKEYYGYLLEDADKNMEDYALHFKNSPEEEKEILARGIAGSRNLLNEEFEEVLSLKLEELKLLSTEVREIKTDLLQFDLKNQTWAKQVGAFGKKTALLNASISEEIDFWQNVINQNSSDHQIAALSYLRAILESDININTFLEIYNKIFVEEGDELIQVAEMPTSNSAWAAMESDETSDWGIYYKLLGLNKGQDPEFTQALKLANETIDSIQINFEQKIMQLVSAQNNTLIDPSLYDRKLAATLYISQEQKEKRQAKLVKLRFGKERTAIEEGLQTKKETDVGYLELLSQLEKTEAELDRLDSLTEERDLTPEETTAYDLLVTTYTDLEMDQEVIEQRFEDERSQLLQELSAEQQSQITVIEVAASTEVIYAPRSPAPEVATVPLKDLYNFSENKYLQQYKEQKEREKNIDNSNFAFLDSLDARLKIETEQWKTLFEKRRQIERHLNTLENDYCKNLIDAKTNAKNLAKGLEMATHLLFAFRDYEKNDAQPFYTDTSRIVLTTNNVDSLTGYIMGTSTLDTFQINKKTIVETKKEKNIARWITRKEFDKLQSNELEWNIFLGLLYQRLRSVEDAPNFSTEGIALLVTKFLGITNDMEINRTNLRIKKATTPDRVSFKDYYPFIRSTVDLFNIVITTESYKAKTTTTTKDGLIENAITARSLSDRDSSLQLIPQISNQALSLYENIYAQNYGNAILNAMELLKTMSSQKLSNKEKRKSERAVNAVLTYGTFMANMINAQTSDQVKTILKSVTLPPGSSRIKRETTSSFTINSYLGAAVARDVLVDAPTGINQSAFGAAMSVPIGFTYSISPNWIKNNSSISLFVPLLDLGAITAYRQNPKNDNYSIDNLPEFNWENLFAPGLFAVYNFANSPFSLGVGGQYGPQLRKIQLENADPVFVNSFRFPMAFFNIDVPFFNLHTGSRKIIVE
jgi:hypothetical protein